MTFGSRLRAIRERQDIGLRELSRRTELSLSHLHYIENDEKVPTDPTLRRIAGGLGVSQKELFRARTEAELEELGVPVELNLMLKESGPMTEEQQEELLAFAQELLAKEKRKRAKARKRK